MFAFFWSGFSKKHSIKLEFLFNFFFFGLMYPNWVDGWVGVIPKVLIYPLSTKEHDSKIFFKNFLLFLIIWSAGIISILAFLSKFLISSTLKIADINVFLEKGSKIILRYFIL